MHFGSLVAALGSFLWSRGAGGRWLVRMEDLDTPRTVPGAAEEILRALEIHALQWDEPVWWQSRRTEAYAEALAGLRKGGWVYACGCSRRQIAALGLRGEFGFRYPGSCRNRALPWSARRAIRLSSNGPITSFEDAVRGPQSQRVAEAVGDFVLRRADGLHAYQLAVVVDDAAQGVDMVVRGADLLGSTPRQILLQRRLGLPTPGYAHLPLALTKAGVKLSKQSHAAPLNLRQPGTNLTAALRFLGQRPPSELATESPATVLDWALAHWSPSAVPGADLTIDDSPDPGQRDLRPDSTIA